MDARVRWLRRFRAAVSAGRAEFIELMREELGKPEHEALTADLLPLLACCAWHERHADRLLAPSRVRGRPWWMLGVRQRVLRAPLGTVAIIATWNYPVQLLGIQLVQAIMAGNRVVVKPSEHAPRTQLRLLELARAADLPEGVLTWTKATREAGRELLERRRFDHVVFTGSTAVGRQIAQVLAPLLTPSSLELSGRDSALVLADADPGLAARTLWDAMARNAGQTCMAPRRVLVDRAIYPRFLHALAPLAAAARPRRLVSALAARECFDACSAAVRDGARSLSGVLEPPREALMRPLAIVDCPADAALVDGAHFGPAFAVVPVGSLEEALAIHLRCGQHLATSIFTADRGAAERLAPRLGAGSITINDCVIPTAHPGVSIHGSGASGWGTTRGADGLLAMTRAITISVTGSRLRTPPGEPSPAVVGWMHRLIARVYGGARQPTPRGASAAAVPIPAPAAGELALPSSTSTHAPTPAPTTPPVGGPARRPVASA
ncbi:MAG: aldehyde dehydrogenase family protein [Phycisphaerales bacterium]|nr:aldehyde dehydrogenase family protein [Phycisphaerales bacterium]